MMAGITVFTGGVLIVVGMLGFIATGSEHYTALIPAGLGAVLALLGGLSFQESLRKHTMHAAALVGLIGFLACGIMAAPSLPKLVSEGKVMKPKEEGGERDATGSVISQAVTGVVCAVFVGLCINSFIQARRRRTQAAATGGSGTV